MKMRKRVLLLGAAGKIGTDFREEYLEKYQKYYKLVLGVHNKKFKDKRFKVFYVELTNIDELKKAMRSVDVVVNLAANPRPSAEFKDIVEPNLIGAYNVFEAARQSKCKRVVFASSIHAIKNYPDGYKILSTDAPKPENFYGASKAFGEALCNVFSLKYNLSCLAIRIGAYISDDKKSIICRSRSNFDYVISQRDMGQLIHKSIIAPAKIKYGILSGISNNKEKRMSLKFTKKLIGYKPEDDAFVMCKVIEHKFGKKNENQESN